MANDRFRSTPMIASIAVVALLAAGSAAQAASLEVFSVSPAFSTYNVAGRTVTIKGIGFTPSTTVTISNLAATPVTYVDSRTLIATVPVVAAASVGTIVLTDAAHGTDSFFPFLHTGPILYVATTGNDSKAGTNPAEPKRTITSALAAAGGTTPTEIRVASGRYVESQLSILNDTALSCGWAAGFVSRDPDRQVTDIDANRGGYAFRTYGLSSVSTVDGCTVRNGLRDGFGGGAFAITADHSVLNNNVIVGNLSTTMGGAIYWTASTSYGGEPTFSNNVILGNRAHAKNGGGIVLYPNYNTQQAVRVNVTGNYIVGNRSVSGRGGGIAITTGSYAGYNTGHFAVADNVIEWNRARTGGGVDLSMLTYGDGFDVTIENNLIMGNSVAGAGGGLALQGLGALTGAVRGNTIANNTAGYQQGGGFFISGSVRIDTGFTATDLILWGNLEGDAAAQAVEHVVYSNSGTPLPGMGNISADPAFVGGPLGGFYLRQSDPNLNPDSPSVDAGSDLAQALSLEGLTTRSDLALDAGMADQGYHYPPTGADSNTPISFLRLDPASGDFGGKDWVLIRGDGFDPGVAVAFGGVPASRVVYVSAAKVLAQPAPHAQGFVDLRITNPDATYVAATSAYRYVDNEAPVWPTTTGVVSAQTGVDCVRTVILDWNEAVDAAGANPIVYEVYREECISTTSTSVPCANFGYIPNATNFVGSTLETFYVDPNFVSGGQDPKFLYTVRARDSANPTPNKEWNFSKRLSLASAIPSDTTPPATIGNTLYWSSGTTVLDWTGANGATGYGVYRETSASAYGSPGSLTKYATLTTANNDVNGDGVTDSQYTDMGGPPGGQCFFYKVTAIDACNVETIPADLLP